VNKIRTDVSISETFALTTEASFFIVFSYKLRKKTCRCW